jgi:predicted DNA-binding protein (MmcQ/YjbR family)
MGLHDRDGFTRFVTGLAGVTVNAQWESLVAKVGGKAFCLRSEAGGDLVFKVSELAYEGLVALEGIGQAAYFAKGSWVRVAPGALEEALLEGYVHEAHRLIAAKLTRKARAELGL